ncbi:Hint domain-containing protein [Saccharomonospora halophila]|uniref:Hint domain-containing protein n=1 Tax=Saccharomonospora halophila TaxID=129922 RepID=UPI000381FB43|nr:Hint domain-containing protein [Saccharomonospora halophila]
MFRLPKIAVKVKDAVQNTVRWMRRRDKAQADLRKVHEAQQRLSRDCNSFVPGTTVLLADGSREPIEEIQLGDEVLATDPDTGESAPRAVVATIVGEGEKTLVEIDTAGAAAGGGTDSVVATAEHPFWTGPIDGWVNADQLTPGTWLRTGSGTWIQVTTVESRTAHQRVHNLTIDGDHTYHVGEVGILTHNAECELGSGFPDRKLPRVNGEPVPDVGHPHSQLGRKKGRNGSYPQAREFDEHGNPVRDLDFTDHGRPRDHDNPHQHPYIPNPIGGTPQRGGAEPLQYPLHVERC